MVIRRLVRPVDLRTPRVLSFRVSVDGICNPFFFWGSGSALGYRMFCRWKSWLAGRTAKAKLCFGAVLLIMKYAKGVNYLKRRLGRPLRVKFCISMFFPFGLWDGNVLWQS